MNRKKTILALFNTTGEGTLAQTGVLLNPVGLIMTPDDLTSGVAHTVRGLFKATEVTIVVLGRGPHVETTTGLGTFVTTGVPPDDLMRAAGCGITGLISSAGEAPTTLLGLPTFDGTLTLAANWGIVLALTFCCTAGHTGETDDCGGDGALTTMLGLGFIISDGKLVFMRFSAGSPVSSRDSDDDLKCND